MKCTAHPASCNGVRGASLVPPLLGPTCTMTSRTNCNFSTAREERTKGYKSGFAAPRFRQLNAHVRRNQCSSIVSNATPSSAAIDGSNKIVLASDCRGQRTRGGQEIGTVSPGRELELIFPSTAI